MFSPVDFELVEALGLKGLHRAFYQSSAAGSGPSLTNKKVLRYRQGVEPIADRFIGLRQDCWPI